MGISSDTGFGERMESFGDEVGQAGYAGLTTSLGRFGKEEKKKSNILQARVWAEGLDHQSGGAGPGRSDVGGNSGNRAPPRLSRCAHPHSLVLLQPQEVVPAFSMDAVEDTIRVDALHERQMTAQTHHHLEEELQKGDGLCVRPAGRQPRDGEPGCLLWRHPAKRQEIRREERKHVGNNTNPQHILRQRTGHQQWNRVSKVWFPMSDTWLQMAVPETEVSYSSVTKLLFRGLSSALTHRLSHKDPRCPTSAETSLSVTDLTCNITARE